MNVAFTPQGLQDLFYWSENDKKKVLLIEKLIKDIKRNRYQGIGHPKPLTGDKSGWYRRIIDKEHRLVYRIVNDEVIEIAQCKGHYNDK